MAVTMSNTREDDMIARHLHLGDFFSVVNKLLSDAGDFDKMLF